MKTIIFAGPTISADDVSQILEAECRGPVAQGDVYKACLDGAETIGIIDGYFDGVPSVWHKEILWAIAKGVQVFGSASMGALRAAELDAFGMIGVGKIYEDYRDDILEDDDEVAIVHGPAEIGYVCLSEPMVSIRATIEEAVACQTVSISQGAMLIERAKNLHYRSRTWQAVLDETGSILNDCETENLKNWLQSGCVDLKRNDAVLMLQTMAEGRSKKSESDYDFEHSLVWEELTARVGGSHSDIGEECLAVLDELRLQKDFFVRTEREVHFRKLAEDAVEDKDMMRTPVQ